jgi:hypothetical protein
MRAGPAFGGAVRARPPFPASADRAKGRAGLTARLESTTRPRRGRRANPDLDRRFAASSGRNPCARGACQRSAWRGGGNGPASASCRTRGLWSPRRTVRVPTTEWRRCCRSRALRCRTRPRMQGSIHRRWCRSGPQLVRHGRLRLSTVLRSGSCPSGRWRSCRSTPIRSATQLIRRAARTRRRCCRPCRLCRALHTLLM